MIYLTNKGYIVSTTNSFVHEIHLFIDDTHYDIIKEYKEIYEIIEYGDLVYTRDRFGLIKAHAILQDKYDMFNLKRWLKHNKDKIYKIYKPSKDGFKEVKL